jgi:FixJ family two-component response regulator
LAGRENGPKIIIISAHDDVAVRDRLAGGAVAFLRKPFNDELLIVTLGDALKRHVGA